jgi:uncharacterized protein
MNFEWDEDKRLINIERHGFDFLDAVSMFDGRPVLTLASTFAAEERHLTVGSFNERFVTAVWTWRDDAIRLISVRSARDGEKREYLAHVAR